MMKCAFPGSGEDKVKLRPASAVFIGLAHFRFEMSFAFESPEGDLQGSDADFAFQSAFDLILDSNAIGVTVEYADGEKDDFFEFPELIFFHSHNSANVLIQLLQNRNRRM